jgi:iron(III) transport system substrate-binding protein
MYNDRYYQPDEAPQTWDDLLKPDWTGKVVIRKPHHSGTMRTFIGSTFLREDSDEAAIDWLRKLHTQTDSYTSDPQELYDRVKRNEDLVSVWLMPDLALQRDRHGYPFAWVAPPEAPVLTEGIAIVKNAPNPDRAKQFYEFVTTTEALAHQAQAYAKLPTRNDVDKAELPEWMTAQTIDAQPIDWKTFAENETAWFDRWDAEVYKAQ